MVSDFIFDGRSLSSFGYILVYTNTEDTQDVSEMEIESIKGARNDKAYSVGYKYDNNYIATYTIIKNFCEFPDNQDMTDEEVSEMTRWLCRKQYKWFRFVDDENDDEVWYKAQWTAKKKYIGDSVVGLDITIHTNAPYGFSKEIEHTYNTSTFTINVGSDEEGYIYPDITLKLLEGGDLEIKNNFEGDRVTSLKNCAEDETITFLGYDLQQIKSTDSNHDFINDYNYKFPRLCCEYGNGVNVFEINKNCVVTMKYREIRKVGLK